jgi:peptidyl-prolyl cis-trans isomerase A (cyclophilin A)
MLTLCSTLILAAQVAGQTTPTAVSAPPARGPVVVLSTSMGKIVIALDQEKAPITVSNFLKYVRAGHYDRTLFHRVIPNFMIQGGGYAEDMSESPTRPPIKNESLNGLANRRGTIAMARTSDPNSATAQFFINLKDNTQLDGHLSRPGYAVFGEVREGMDVVDRIAVVPTKAQGMHQNLPVTAVVIRTAREAPAAKPAGPQPAAPKPTPEAKAGAQAPQPAAATPAP